MASFKEEIDYFLSWNCAKVYKKLEQKENNNNFIQELTKGWDGEKNCVLF